MLKVYKENNVFIKPGSILMLGIWIFGHTQIRFIVAVKWTNYDASSVSDGDVDGFACLI